MTSPGDARPSLHAEPPAPRRLMRSATDRKIAGVCGGVAEYAGIDANLVRLVMVALALFGGGGLVLYLVAWVLLPEPGQDTPPWR